MLDATGSSATTAARPRRKGEITAERILDAAEQLFAERGYGATTLRDVAAAVGIRNPSLYNHFSSKESLYAAVLERGIRPVLDMLAADVESGGEGAGPGQVISEVMGVLADHPHLPRLVQHETLAGGQHLTPMLREWIVPVFANANRAASNRGDWREDHIPLLVLAMYNVVVGYFGAAALLGDLSGDDLLTKSALERQTDFLVEFVSRLFPKRPSPHTAG